MWQPSGEDNKDDATSTKSISDIEKEIKILNFLIHNEAKIMYALRHNGKKLYTFDVDNYVDVMNEIKKKRFYVFEQEPDETKKRENKNLLFNIFNIVNKNINLNI